MATATHSGWLAAMVLAAGESSRMGDVKALLPLGGKTILARVVGSLRSAGVEEVVVVTGYHSDRVADAAAALDLRVAHNARPERGMFSSVQTGAAALSGSAAGLFIFPVDYPLVRPAVLASLMEALRGGEYEVVHPACAGVRGHPPLLAGALRDPLVVAPAHSDLRSFLAGYEERALEVEMEDLSILLDVDTPADLQRARRLAAFMDATTPGLEHASGPSAQALAEEDALQLLTLLRAPDNVLAHCRAVAQVGEAVAAALHPHLPRLDVDLVRSACLLHDMVRGQGARKHALMGERILRNLGTHRLADVVGAHMVLPFEPADASSISEEELVYLADKMVVEDRLAGLAGREQRALERCGGDPAAQRGIRERIRVGEVIAAKVEAVLGRPLQQVVVAAGLPAATD